MTQSTPPEVRVGQIWQCQDQSLWVRVTNIDRPETDHRLFHIAYISAGLSGQMAHRAFADWDGTGYPVNATHPGRKLVRVIYDPEDQ